MQNPSKVDNIQHDNTPAEGEVQERFNPRPYFDFVFDDTPPRDRRPNSNTKETDTLQGNTKAPTIVYGTPINSIQLPNDAYSSPFNSYNPPNIKPYNSKQNLENTKDFLPNENNNESSPSNPMIDSTTEALFDTYDSVNDNQNVPDLNPPLASPQFFTTPKEEHNLYFMSDDNQHYNPHSNNHGPPIYATVEPPESVQSPYLDHPPTNQHHQKPMQTMTDDDLAPPPEDLHYGKIPQYLDHEPKDHVFYYFGQHPVYHETKMTTTTTQAPRAGHYSYYYLGRKLWYIPLYFSVYFIVYVTILILKSIARHKIQFSHHFDKSRNSRELDIDQVNRTVVNSINSAIGKYM